jgi:hypothetical protein
MHKPLEVDPRNYLFVYEQGIARPNKSITEYQRNPEQTLII